MLSHFSCVWLFATLWTLICQALLPMGFSKQKSWVGYHFLFQRIFPTQGSNPHLLRLLHLRAFSLPLPPPRKPLWNRGSDFFFFFNVIKMASLCPSIIIIFKKLFIFNWSIITLQYCVGFWHTPTCISHSFTYTPSLLNLPPISHPCPFIIF